MFKNRTFNLLSLACVIINSFIILLNWNSLPAEIPSHFSTSGAPDTFASKWLMLLFPLLSIGIYFFTGLMIKNPSMVRNYPYHITTETRNAHYEVIREMGSWIRFGIIWIFTYIEILLIDYITGSNKINGLSLIFPIVLVIFVTVLIMRKGNKINSNESKISRQ